LALAGACLFLHDPPRGTQDDPDIAAHGPIKGGMATYKALLGNPAYSMTVLGYAAYTFALGGMAFWMPTFLERERGYSHQDATVQFGAIVVVTGFVGTFAGGWLGDLMLKHSRQAYLWVSGIATLLAAPCAYLAFTSPDRAVMLAALVGAELLIFASTGPINSAIVNVVAPDMRASAVALSILAIHVLGDVPSPPLIGKLSDLSNLSSAVLLVPVMVLVGGLIWSAAAFLGGKRGWAS
jgi:sugar phosphate permease